MHTITTPITKSLRIISTRANIAFAEEIANYLGTELTDNGTVVFANKEIRVNLGDSVRGDDVFVLIGVEAGKDPHASIMEGLQLIRACKENDARRRIAILPYYPYARQDKPDPDGREATTARLLADLLYAAGATHVAAADLHASQIQGFFDGPFLNLYAMPILVDYLDKKFGGVVEGKRYFDVEVVSPDAGRTELITRYVRQLPGSNPAVVYKNHAPGTVNHVESKFIMGHVPGRRCRLVVDDMIDTGGTIIMAVEQLGGENAYLMATHAVLSNNAAAKLAQHPLIEKIVVVNTMGLNIPEEYAHKFEVLSMAPFFGEAILRIFNGGSVSGMYPKPVAK